MSHDVINSPSHYAEGRKYEPIAVIEDWSLGYHLGNALKYISRAGRKDDVLQDLRKAAWYVNREIERLEGAEAPAKEEVTFLTEDLYDTKYVWLTLVVTSGIPPCPIELPADCIQAAQPVDLFGASGEDTIVLTEDVVPMLKKLLLVSLQGFTPTPSTDKLNPHFSTS